MRYITVINKANKNGTLCDGMEHFSLEAVDAQTASHTLSPLSPRWLNVVEALIVEKLIYPIILIRDSFS